MARFLQETVEEMAHLDARGKAKKGNQPTLKEFADLLHRIRSGDAEVHIFFT